MASRLQAVSDAADNGRTRLANTLKVLDATIGGSRKFVAGSPPHDRRLHAARGPSSSPNSRRCRSIRRFKNVTRWYAGFKERPSAQV